MPEIDLCTLLGLVGALNDRADSDSASQRFREYLAGNVHRADDVSDYVDDALANSGDQFNKALQDLINHIGHLLGFEVTYGRYRGVRNEIGFDGLWQSPAGWAIVVETKTTDTYTVRTDTLLGYINGLISEATIEDPKRTLGLYVYGRFDAATNQLENAIIAEGRREDLRVSSVDALLNLLSLMQNYDLGHEMVLRLLLPAPVRVDSLVNLLHDVVAQEREEGEEEPEPTLAVEPALERPDEGTEAMRTRSSLVSIDKAYTGTTPRTVKLLGKRYEVRTWKEAALRVFEVLRVRNQERFEEVAVTAVGRTRPYITRNRDLLRMPERIPHTELYFETNLSSNWIVRLCTTLVLGMGHSRSDIEFRIAD